LAEISEKLKRKLAEHTPSPTTRFGKTAKERIYQQMLGESGHMTRKVSRIQGHEKFKELWPLSVAATDGK